MQTTETHKFDLELSVAELSLVIDALRAFKPMPDDVPALFLNAIDAMNPLLNEEQREAKVMETRDRIREAMEKSDTKRIHLMSKLLSLKHE